MVWQPTVAVDDLGQHEQCHVAILDVRVLNHGMRQIAIGVGHDLTLAALVLFTRILTVIALPGTGDVCISSAQ